MASKSKWLSMLFCFKYPNPITVKLSEVYPSRLHSWIDYKNIESASNSKNMPNGFSSQIIHQCNLEGYSSIGLMVNLHTPPYHMRKIIWQLLSVQVSGCCVFWVHPFDEMTKSNSCGTFQHISTHTYSHKANRVILVTPTYTWWTDNLPVAIQCRWRQTVKVRHVPTCLAGQEQDTLSLDQLCVNADCLSNKVNTCCRATHLP